MDKSDTVQQIWAHRQDAQLFSDMTHTHGRSQGGAGGIKIIERFHPKSAAGLARDFLEIVIIKSIMILP